MRLCVSLWKAFPLVLILPLLSLVLRADAQQPAPASVAEPAYEQDEFAPLPTPDWVEMIDQGTLNPDLAGIETPRGIVVEVVAQEPAVINPVGMAFSADGTPHVLEWVHQPDRGRHVSYEITLQDGTKATVNRMEKDVRDRLKVLRDADGNGVYESSDVLMDDLEIPSSLLMHDGWTYLSSLGHVIRRRPENGRWEEQEIVRGLCGFHHHQASGLTLSPDGWLFITSGDDDNHGEGSDGSRVTVLRTGTIVRCRPDGSHLTEHARGFRNPYRDVVFDHYYNMFHVDNDQEDGSKFQGVRLMHVLEGADYGWRLREGTVCCRTDFARGAVFGEAPGKMPSLLKTGRGSPAGLLIYQGVQFPEFFRGLLIYPDVYRKMVRAYQIERRGSTFAVTHQFVLMRSEHGLFRPCHAVAGPDGAIYIVDWRTDSGGAGQLSGDGQHGRIYRLRWGGTEDAPAIALAPRDRWAKLTSAPQETLWEALESPEFEIRKRALEELLKREDVDRMRFVDVALDTNRPGPTRAAAMGAACREYHPHVEQALCFLLSDRSPELRRLAAEYLDRQAAPRSEVFGFLHPLINGDPHPAVRRAAVLAAARLAARLPASSPEFNHTADLLLDGLLLGDAAGKFATDQYLYDGYIRGLEQLGWPGIERIVGLLKDKHGDHRELVLRSLLAMRTRAAAEVTDELLDSDPQGFSPEQMAQLLMVHRNILVEPAIQADSVARWMLRHGDAPTAVQVAGLETLGLVGSSQAQAMTDLAIRLLGHKDAETRMAVIRAIGEASLVAASDPLAKALADPKRSVEERLAIVEALSQLRSRIAPFTGVKSPPGVELVLEQLAIIARSPEIGPVRGNVLSLIAQVNFALAEGVARQLLDSNDAEQMSAAIEVLGARPDLALQIGQQFVDGKINRDLLPQVAAALQTHAAKDQSEAFANMLAQVFRGGLLVSLDKPEVERVEKLVAEQGNPIRGRATFLDQKTQCAKCHKLEGQGGQVGPDLSKVWQTHTVPKLLETLLDPSKEIKEGYGTWTVTTVGGQVYTGLKIMQTKQEVVIREASGKDIRIAAGDIDEMFESKKSLMPEGVVSQLSFEQFIDLVAFLKDRDAQQYLRDKDAPTAPQVIQGGE